MSTNAAVPPTSRRPVVTVSRLVERLLGGSRDAAGRPKDSIEEAEEAGLVFAFRARCVAILIVALALVAIVSWPRDLYYLAFVAAFFVSGYVPFRLRRHPRAELVKLGFVVLDVALIAAAILNFPASNLSIDWPIQARLRNQNFLFMLLLLGEAALTYSPRRVVWTGASIATIWSLSFIYLYQLPESKRYGDMGRQQTDSELLNLFLNPTYVSLPQWLAQLIATGILTALLAIAVHRSRMHLLAQVEAQVLRSELARYVSPDVADALAQNPAAEFGAPTVRQVAVLFADIVGFTRLNERLSPERTLGLIRSFQERSTAVVFRHRGTLDKYLGDGFMATFGGLREEPDAPARAIACAFALKAEFERWNAKRSARQADQISVAIGVHFGSVVVGNFGVERRIEFTVLGDVVNVASRLEKATRELGCIIAVSDDCARAAAETMHLSNFDRSVRSAGAVRPSSFTRPEYLNKVVQAHDGAFLSREASPEEHSKDLSVIQGRLQQRREHRQIGCLSNRPVRPSCAQVTVLVASTEQAVRRESRTRVMAIHQPESQPL